jgi:hypothetical protein
MPTPDVRVRLSVEGTPEVLAALRKVSDEAKRTSASAGGAGGGFKALNGVLAGTKGLLAQLGIAVSVGALTALARNATGAADEIGKMSQRVGASIANMSALALAARGAGVDVGTLQTGLGAFARRLAELEGGSAEAVRAFRAIGLSARDFKGKDTAERFDIVARKFGAMRDSSEKAALAMAVFGKNAASLIPLMNDLSKGGLEAARAKAEALGLLLSDRMVASVTRVKDDFGEMGAVLQGLALQLVDGLGPAMNQVSKIMQDSAPAVAEGWKLVGSVLGKLLVPVVALLATVIGTFYTNVAALIDWLVTAGRMGLAILRADYAEADRLWDEQAKRQADRYKQLGQSLKKTWADAWSTPEAPALKGGGVTDADLTQLYRERQDAIRDGLEAEQKLTEAKLKAREEAEKRAFERGLIGVREYFRRRREIFRLEQEAELKKLRGMLAAEQANPNPDQGQHEKAVRGYRTQIRVLEAGRAGREASFTAEEETEVERLNLAWIAGEQKIMEAQGQRHEAEMLRITQEGEAWEKTILQRTGSPDLAALQRQRLESALRAAEDFRVAMEQADAALAAYEAERSRIESDAQAAGLDELTVKAQILALERERLPVLRASAEAALAAARATGDAQSIAQAQAAVDGLRNLGVEARNTGQLLRSVIGTVADFFASGINQVEDFEDAVRTLGISLAQMIQQLIVQMAQMALLRAMFGTPVGMADGGPVQGYATGGIVRGPGGPVSDTVPALLSPGEYVVNARAVGMPGVYPILEMLNRMNHASGVHARRLAEDPRLVDLRPTLHFHMPDARDYAAGYAEGGLVPVGGAGKSQFTGSLTVNLPAGARMEGAQAYLESQDGVRHIIHLLAKNRRAASAALRR